MEDYQDFEEFRNILKTFRILAEKKTIIDDTSRYFFDKITKKCVKFGGCTDVGEEENNFESRQKCSDICKVKR